MPPAFEGYKRGSGRNRVNASVHKFRNLWHSFSEGVSCNDSTSDTGYGDSTGSGDMPYDRACQTTKPNTALKSSYFGKSMALKPPSMPSASAAAPSIAGKQRAKPGTRKR